MAPSVTGHAHMAGVLASDDAASESDLASLGGLHDLGLGIAVDDRRRGSAAGRAAQVMGSRGSCHG